MATIKKQDIIDNFRVYITDISGEGLSWYTGNKPFDDFNADNLGGSVDGLTDSLTASDFDTLISADNIFDVLVQELGNFTRIKSLQAKLNIKGDGYSSGSSKTDASITINSITYYLTADAALGSVTACNVGVVTDVTGYVVFTDDTTAHDFHSTVNITQTSTPIQSGMRIYSFDTYDGGLFYQQLQDEFLRIRELEWIIQTNMCHCSCHTSCHSSRGRR